MQKYKDIFSKYYGNNKLKEEFDYLQSLEFDTLAAASNAMIALSESNINKSNTNYALMIAEINNSNRVEGINQSLVQSGMSYFDKSDKLVRPVGYGTLKYQRIDRSIIDKIAEDIFKESVNEDRYKDSYGIYNKTNKVKLYEPPIKKEVIEKEYKKYWDKAFTGSLSHALLNHIWFQKIHPYVDGNGRVGRYVLEHIIYQWMSRMFNKELVRVLPLSWAIRKNLSAYYDLFDLKDNKINLKPLFNILIDTYNQIEKYAIGLKELSEGLKSEISKTTTKKDELLFNYISTSIIFRQKELLRDFNINPKTLTSMMNKLNEQGLFNIERKGQNVFYINIEHEQLLHTMFN